MWGHEFVQSQFIGQLVNRRKVYPASLRSTLERNRSLRETADYEWDDVTEVRAARAVGRTEEFVAVVSPPVGSQR